jgi:hypothetical protein
MDTTDPLDRLTILERAQLLHDATLRRHGEMLDTHAVALAELRGIQERQERLMETLTAIAAQHEERMAKLQQTLDAIKDMLDRGNGH